MTDTLSHIEEKEPITKPQLPEIGELLEILRAANSESGARDLDTEYERMLKMYEITLRLMASVESRYSETSSIKEGVEKYFEDKLCHLCNTD